MPTVFEDAELSPARQSEFLLAGRNSFLPAGIIYTVAPVTSARPFSHPEQALGILASAQDALAQTKCSSSLDCGADPERRQSGRTVENPAGAINSQLPSTLDFVLPVAPGCILPAALVSAPPPQKHKTDRCSRTVPWIRDLRARPD